jgi:hypothetical protein
MTCTTFGPGASGARRPAVLAGVTRPVVEAQISKKLPFDCWFDYPAGTMSLPSLQCLRRAELILIYN